VTARQAHAPDFERIDVDIIVRPTGSAERARSFRYNGAGPPSTGVLPQDRQDGDTAKALMTAPSGHGSAPRCRHRTHRQR